MSQINYDNNISAVHKEVLFKVYIPMAIYFYNHNYNHNHFGAKVMKYHNLNTTVAILNCQYNDKIETMEHIIEQFNWIGYRDHRVTTNNFLKDYDQINIDVSKFLLEGNIQCTICSKENQDNRYYFVIKFVSHVWPNLLLTFVDFDTVEETTWNQINLREIY